MMRAWIEEGVRHAAEREVARRHALDRKQHWHRLIEERGPATLRALVDEMAAALDDYRGTAPASDAAVAFERLPQGGFSVSRSAAPRAILQGRPDYQLETVNCNWAHVGDNEGEMVEVPFNLHFTVDESDEVGLRYRSRAFQDVAEIAEFLLAPLLFPELRRGLAQPVVAEHY